MNDWKRPPKWKRPPWKWKNLKCPVCGLWINRERIVEHAQTPIHQEAVRRRQRSAA